VLSAFAEGDGKILVFGRAAENRGNWLSELMTKPTVVHCPDDASKPKALSSFSKAFEGIYSDVWQIRSNNRHLGLQPHLTSTGLAIHLLNYRYSQQDDRVLSIPECTLKIRKSEFPGRKIWDRIDIHTLGDGKLEYALEDSGDVLTLKLRHLPLYAIVSFLSQRG
jgi:hypothetical protein